MDHLKQVAGGLGLPLGDRKMTYNSRLAQELGKWSESMGKGNAFHHAMFRAYFVDGENIAKDHVLVKVARSIGLNGDETRRVIQARTYSKAVDLDWKRSYELSVNAVPTFLFERQILVGVQKYESLERLLLSKHVKRRY